MFATIVNDHLPPLREINVAPVTIQGLGGSRGGIIEGISKMTTIIFKEGCAVCFSVVNRLSVNYPEGVGDQGQGRG